MDCLRSKLYISTLTNKSDKSIGLKLYDEIMELYSNEPWCKLPKFLTYSFRGTAHKESFYVKKFKSMERHFNHHQEFENKVGGLARCNTL